MALILFLLAGLGFVVGCIDEQASKTIFQQQFGAIEIGISAMLLAAAFILDALKSQQRIAQRAAEVEAKLAIDLLAAIGKFSSQAAAQRELLEILVAQIRSTEGATAGNRQKAIAHLHNIDASAEHTNKLLQWIGEMKQSGPVA